MKQLTKSFAPFFLSVIFLFSACDQFKNITDPDDSGNYTYYFWLAAKQDAHVTSIMPDFNNDGAYSLVCSHGGANEANRTYIQFFMPQLPKGTKVLEAYINVYEDSQQQPGTDRIQVGEVIDDWDAYTLTWNNQPNPLGNLNSGIYIGQYLTYNMWRTTEDIKGIVQSHLDDPASNFGWIFNNNASNAYTRSFASLNATDGRTRTELQNGPRLLMKVETDTELNTANVGTTLTGNTELGNMYGFNQDILVYYMQSGNEWPATWEVATR